MLSSAKPARPEADSWDFDKIILFEKVEKFGFTVYAEPSPTSAGGGGLLYAASVSNQNQYPILLV